MYEYKFIIVALSISVYLIYNCVETCNEAVCARVVSKCLLTQSCKCDLKNCSCCKECFACFGYLYKECCSCVGMCPKSNNTGNPLSSKSHVEDFQEPMPDLFQALMAEPDVLERWHIFTYPVDFDISIYRPKVEKEVKLLTSNNELEVAPRKDVVMLNCTVAFMSQCMSWNKCKSSCQSTGASKYRWFHDGCCECIGHTCINYGINESRCKNCPVMKEDSLEDQAGFFFDGEVYNSLRMEDKSFRHAQAEGQRMSYGP